MDFIQILAETATTDPCKGLGPLVALIKNGLLPIIQIGVPIILIVMGSIDLGKAVLSSDDKEIKGAVGKLIRRAIAAVAVFFVATLVTVVMNMLAGTGARSSDNEGWGKCWETGGKAKQAD